MKNSITINNNTVSLQVGVYLFAEDGCQIAFCPSLDLCGYGLTIDEARKDFEFVMQNYLSDQINAGTLQEDLIKHGWKISDNKADEPSFVEIVVKNEQMKKLGDKQFSKINVPYTSSCPA